MTIIKRYFHQISPKSDTAPDSPFSDYSDKRLVVILGAPGIGKTTEFKSAHGNEKSTSIWCTVNQFINDPVERYEGKTLFIDALDEHRAEVGDGQTAINQVRGRLLELGSPKVRLSCRNEEWSGGSDLQALFDVAPNENIYVLQMAPMSEADIITMAERVLSDPDGFITGARDRQLMDILGNPQTLNLYMEVYENDDGWPNTRLELLEKSVSILINETNDNHERVRGNQYGDTQIIETSEELAAIVTLSNIDGISLSKTAISKHFPSISSLTGLDKLLCETVTRRRIFAPDGSRAVRLHHKTIGDFLTAKSLIRRITDKKMPMARALSILTGHDGVPLSHLRDVYAWLIALLPSNKADNLIKNDPYGAIIYGDIGLWPDERCRHAIKCLRDYAKNTDPWFRSEWRDVKHIGNLSRVTLLNDIQDLLQTEDKPHVLSLIFDAIDNGEAFPEICDDLLAFIRHNNYERLHWVKSHALRALYNANGQDNKILLSLLDDIHKKKIVDENHSMRTFILRKLYPKVISPSDITKYIGSVNASNFLSIDRLITKDIVAQTPTEELPKLAVAVKRDRDVIKTIDRFNRKRFHGGLIKKLLVELGTKASIKDLFEWLNICYDKLDGIDLDNDDATFIKEYFEANPEQYKLLFLHWVVQTEQAADKNHTFDWHHYDFVAIVHHATPPPDFVELILRTASQTNDNKKEEFLFSLACRTIMHNYDTLKYGDINTLSDYAQSNPNMLQVWEDMRYMEIPDWRKDSASRTAKSKIKKLVTKQKNIETLEPIIELIRNGKHIGHLNWAAQRFYYSRHSANEVETPFQHMCRELDRNISSAIVEGFEAVLRMKEPQSTQDIVKTNHKSQRYSDAFPVLVAIEDVYHKSPDDLIKLPTQNLKTALTYKLVHYGPDEKQVDWEDKVCELKPDLVGELLGDIWRIELSLGQKQRLCRAHISTDDVWGPVVIKEAFSLLKETPVLPTDILEQLLHLILRHGEIAQLREISLDALKNNKLRGVAKIMWQSIAMIFEPNEYYNKLRKSISKNTNFVWAAYEILIVATYHRPSAKQSSFFDYKCFKLLARYFHNVQYPMGESTSGRHGMADAASAFRKLIDRIAVNTEQTVSIYFDDLCTDGSLHAWRDHLKHRRADQLKNMRDAQFKIPTATDVCNILFGGPPANLNDMQAIVMDKLEELSSDIRGGNTNKWKQFWRLAPKGKLDRPKIENDCRDNLIGWLAPEMEAIGVSIEPEAAAADEKRVDIRLTKFKLGTLPIEVKRDDHDELWTAMNDQLVARYANDPKTEGYGIFLVLWFGDKGNGCKKAPKYMGIETPKTAKELQVALEANVPNRLIRVCVIDVSKPHD